MAIWTRKRGFQLLFPIANELYLDLVIRYQVYFVILHPAYKVLEQ